MAGMAADKGIHIHSHILAQVEIQQAGLQQNHLKMEVQRIQGVQSRIQVSQSRTLVSQTQSQGVQIQNQKVFSCLLQ